MCVQDHVKIDFMYFFVLVVLAALLDKDRAHTLTAGRASAEFVPVSKMLCVEVLEGVVDHRT